MQFIKIFALLTLFSVVTAKKEECKKISNCKCQHSKGTIDLSAISSEVFTATKGDQTFRYFPCSQNQDMSSCSKSDNNAVCGLDKTTNQVIGWGLEDSVTFLVPNNVDYNVVIAKFIDGDHKTELYLDCPVGNKARAEGLEVLEVQGDNAELRLTSKAACYIPSSPTNHTTPTKPHTTPTKPHTTPTKPHTTPTKPHTTPTKPHTTPTKPGTSTTPTPIFRIDMKEWGHWYAIAGSAGLFFVLFFFYFVVRLVMRYGGSDKDSTPRESCCYLIGLFFDGILCLCSCFPLCRNAIGRRTRSYEAVSVEEGPINYLSNNNYHSINNNRDTRVRCVIL